MTTPLAEQLRPKSLDDIVGQKHLLGQGMPLRVAFESGTPHNMIFWGPPGVGKTSLARLAAEYFNAQFISLSAVFSGVKEIRQAIDKAEENKRSGHTTILFIDEIHRFNKSQQDALLPFSESGLINIIGATTENPAFELNRALLSRAEVYTLNPLEDEDLDKLIQQVSEVLFPSFELSAENKLFLIQLANGDARRLYNLLSQLKNYIEKQNIQSLQTTKLEKVFGQSIRHGDKQGDIFYDQISALHKSVRGSNPDAALYWFTRIVDAGVDIKYLARRIIRMAWEDIGLADPKALQMANDAALSYERLGSPEGDLALASVVIYLSVAPKSNAAYQAFNQAKAFIKNDIYREVPLHLRNAPTSLAKQLNHGKNYRYAHDEPYGYAAGVNYWPEGLNSFKWYQPVSRGLEIKINEKLNFLNNLDKAATEK